MFEEKQKKMVPYELYISKKMRNGDPLADIMNKKLKQRYINSQAIDIELKDQIKHQINERRLAQLRKQYKQTDNITNPEPYIKRTWVSPYMAQKNGDKCSSINMHMLNLKYIKKKHQNKLKDHENDQFKRVYNCLNMNSKLHYFGDYMYSEFDEKRNALKQNSSQLRKSFKKQPKIVQQLHKQFLKLQHTDSKMVICTLAAKKTKFYNPLKEDKYYSKIMKKQDPELMQILINILSTSNFFSFSSFISFYEIFVWQQSTKNTQIDFVLSLLMKNAEKITVKKLCENIQFFCSKIRLPGANQSLVGFSDVMKKLLIGGSFMSQNSQGCEVSRQMLAENLEKNQQCISIFINVFYCE